MNAVILAATHEAPVILLPSIFACAPKPPPEPAEPVAGHPALSCPAGTTSAGSGPPLGIEVWCARPVVGGGTVREGPAIEFHPDGTVRARGVYVDGRRSGRWDFTYPDGRAERTGSYTVGEPDGPWVTYTAAGNIASSGVFVRGHEHGPWEFFDEARGTRLAGDYVDGGRQGKWLETDATGRTLRELQYQGGRLVSVQELPSP